jgi:predicted MFS family arabinose efflux permease
LAEATLPAPWRTLFSGSYARLAAGLLLSETSAGVQVLLLSAVLPAAVRDIGGIQLYGWVLAASAIGVLIATPLAGRAVSRFNSVRILSISAVFAVGGMLLAALAPSMAFIALGLFLVGGGAAAQYTLTLTRVAQDLPAPIRARIFAVMAFGWILPSLIAPPLGGFLASTVGWRWALAAPIPLIVASRVLLVPALRGSRPAQAEGGAAGLLIWSVVLAAGVSAVLSALSNPGVLTFPVFIAGLAAAAAGVRRLFPAGTLTARRGLPASVAVLFLINLSFFAGDGFLPLILTRAFGATLVLASLALTASGISWALAGWWQSQAITARSPTRLAITGTLMLLSGAALVVAALIEAPSLSLLVYAGWTFAGAGMGITVQTVWVQGTENASSGGEGVIVSSMLLAETIGLSLGTGISGGAVALAKSLHEPLRNGFLGAFIFVAAVAAFAVVLAPRVHRRRSVDQP